MNLTELNNYIATEAEQLTNYTVESELITAYPFKDIDTKEVRFSVAYITKLVDPAKAKNHTTLLAYDGEEFFFWCGDGYIDNTTSVSLSQAKKMVSESLVDVKEEVGEAQKELDALYHSQDKSTGCHFWANWKGRGKICKHVKDLLKRVEGNDIIEELQEKWNHYMTSGASTTTTSSSSGLSKLQRYAFKKHILTTGPKGFGKTWEAYQFIDDQKIPEKDVFEIGGFEGLESIDLLGQNIPYVKEVKKSKKAITLKGNNSFASSDDTEHIQDLVWLNGALSAAFANASKGNKTVLLIDEMFRIPARELSILIASLTPDNKGFFTLRTRRVLGLDENGCGIEEVIKVKKENLWVMATTNVGADYDIEEIDAAFEDRFMIIHKSPQRTTIKTIVENAAKERKFSTSLVKNLMEFYDKISSYNSIGELSKIINTRHLSEAIELANDEDDIVEVLRDMKLKWIDRDISGEPDATHIELIDKTLASIWS